MLNSSKNMYGSAFYRKIDTNTCQLKYSILFYFHPSFLYDLIIIVIYKKSYLYKNLYKISVSACDHKKLFLCIFNYLDFV